MWRKAVQSTKCGVNYLLSLHGVLATFSLASYFHLFIVPGVLTPLIMPWFTTFSQVFHRNLFQRDKAFIKKEIIITTCK
jgi:hypothetical protein